MAEADKILGVDREILERFLTLLKEKYPEVDKANYFLELNTGVSGINVGITNQRDAVSHLVSLLLHPERNREDQLAQVNGAEEHLRRAIIESYEQAVNKKLESLVKLFTAYKQVVAPLLNPVADPAVAGAPDVEEIRDRLNHIRELRQKGRETKARNRWDATWEEGVEQLVKAFEMTAKLEETIEKYVNAAIPVRDARRSRRLTILSIILGTAVGVLGIIVAILIAT